MKIDGISLKDHLRHAWKSLTVKVAATLMVLPDVLLLIQANFKDIAPYVPDFLESRALNLCALLMFLLRLKTTTSLAAKAK